MRGRFRERSHVCKKVGSVRVREERERKGKKIEGGGKRNIEK
jgi:hypothetical protein